MASTGAQSWLPHFLALRPQMPHRPTMRVRKMLGTFQVWSRASMYRGWDTRNTRPRRIRYLGMERVRHAPTTMHQQYSGKAMRPMTRRS